VVLLRGPNPGPNDHELPGSLRFSMFTGWSFVPTVRRLRLEKAPPDPDTSPAWTDW